MRKQAHQFPLERDERDFPHGRARVHQDVPAARKVGTIQPEYFPYSPPQAVAHHSIPHPHRRGDAQA